MFNFHLNLWGNVLRKIGLKNWIFIGLKFYSVSVSPTTKFYSIYVSATTKFYSISVSPTTKFYSIWMSPTTALDSSWGVRQSRSLAKGFPPQTEEHWGSLHKMRSTISLLIVHCTVYSVQCTVYTVHCILYTVHPHLSVTGARQSPVLLISTSAEQGSHTTYPPSQVLVSGTPKLSTISILKKFQILFLGLFLYNFFLNIFLLLPIGDICMAKFSKLMKPTL